MHLLHRSSAVCELEADQSLQHRPKAAPLLVLGEALASNAGELGLDWVRPLASAFIEGRLKRLFFVLDEDGIQAAPVILHFPRDQLEEDDAVRVRFRLVIISAALLVAWALVAGGTETAT